MPKQRRTFGKNSKQIGSKGNIKIACPEMTLTGFEHPSKTIAMKKKLDTVSICSEFQDAISSGRRSRSRISLDSFREDLQNQPSEGKSGRSTNRDGFQVIEPSEVPPMNEDIILQDEKPDLDEPGIVTAETVNQKATCENVLPHGCDPDELNPKNYAFLPSCWTSKIRPAGKATHKT